MMDLSTLREIVSQGESGTVEFKSAEVRLEALAREIVAFSNRLGGVMLIGVEDGGRMSGLRAEKTDEWVASICRTSVVPAANPTISVINAGDVRIGAVEVPKGISKPCQTTRAPRALAG